MSTTMTKDQVKVGALQTSAADPNSAFWLQFMQALSDTVQLPGAVQAIYPFEVWNWGGQSTLPTMTFQQYQVLNPVPSSPVNNTNAAASAQGFGETYQNWLYVLNGQPGQTDPQYLRLQQAVSVASGTLATDQNTAAAAYANFVSSTSSTETYTQWLANEGAPYGAQITLDKGTLTNAQTALSNYLANMSGPITNAASQYNGNLVSVVNPAGQQVKVPGWFTSQSPYSYVLGITGQNFGGNATKGNALSVSFNQASSSYDYSSQYSQSTTEKDYFFVSVLENNTWSQVDMSQYSSDYTVNFNFQDLTTVAVTPGQWYNSGLVGVHKNGPYYQGYSGFADTAGDTYFFGQGGLMARQVTAMVVGYRPTLTISAGSAFATFMQQQQSSASGVQVGPFYVDFSSSSSFGQAGTMSVSNDTITVTGTGDWPYIIAFSSEWTVPSGS